MKFTYLIVAISLCFSLTTNAQAPSTSAENLMNEAKAQYDKKDFTQARYLYKQAYVAYAAQDEYAKAIECGLKVSALYHRELYYKEAFEMCRTMDQLVYAADAKHQKRFLDLHFAVTKERFDMYLKLRNAEQADTQLSYLEQYTKEPGGESLTDDLLYNKAFYSYTFGHNAEGDAAFNQLIAEYKKTKEYAKVTECYRKLIGVAQRANSAPLVARTYEELIKWHETAKTLTSNDELSVAKRQLNENQVAIQEKDDSLSAKQYIIVGLTVLAVVLGVALLLLGLLFVRYLALTAKQKKSIQIANENNNLKSQFICNISAQMDPALDTLTESAAQLPAAKGMLEQIDALRSFSQHIQELSSLESTLTEPFEMSNIANITRFCESILEEVKPEIQSEVTISTNVPNIPFKSNPEQLARILTHLLRNAALHTEKGKISIEFMKRGAHTFQFVISDTGSGIAAEQQEQLFKPFTSIKDLTKGDGLGLPICALIAIKLNGSLTLDTTYTKGTRFVLKLNA